ncbi:MAG TPA: hypothetical protein VFW56_11875, partial [Bradyrhizobium sp.]|nr:hypothetical protein [Bradyrhizobium sp.]
MAAAWRSGVLFNRRHTLKLSSRGRWSSHFPAVRVSAFHAAAARKSYHIPRRLRAAFRMET